MPLTEKDKRYIKDKILNFSTKKIAKRLNLSVKEIETYLTSLNTPLASTSKETNLNGKQTAFGEGRFFWLLVAAITLAPQFFGIRVLNQEIPKFAFLQISTALLWFVYLGGNLIKNRQLKFIHSPVVWTGAAFLLWCFSSLLWATNPYEGQETLYSWLNAFGIFTLALQLKPSAKQLGVAGLLVFGSAVWTSTLGLSQFYGINFLYANDIPQAAPPAATFGNLNQAAHFVIAALPLCFCLLFCSGKKRKALFGIFALGGFAVCVLYLKATLSAAIFAGGLSGLFFCALLLVLSFLRNGTRKYLATSIIALCLLPVLAGLLIMSKSNSKASEPQATTKIELLNQVLAGNSYGFLGSASISDRAMIYANTAQMIYDHPLLGVGIGNYQIFYPAYHNSVMNDYNFTMTRQLRSCHNDFLQLISETGLPGGILFGAGVFLLLSGCIHALTGKANKQQKALLLLLLYPVFCYVGIGMFSMPFQRALAPSLLGFLCGCAYMLGMNNDNRLKVITVRKSLIVYVLISAGVVALSGQQALNSFRKSDAIHTACLLMDNKQWDGIAANTDRFLPDSQYNKSVLMASVNGLRKTGNLEKSLRLAKLLNILHPYYPQGLLAVSEAYRFSGNISKATEIMLQAHQTLPASEKTTRPLTYLFSIDQKWSNYRKSLPSDKDLIASFDCVKHINGIFEKSKLKRPMLNAERQYLREKLKNDLYLLLYISQNTNQIAGYKTILTSGLAADPENHDLMVLMGMTDLLAGQALEGYTFMEKGIRNTSEMLRVPCLKYMLQATKFLPESNKEIDRLAKMASTMIERKFHSYFSNAFKRAPELGKMQDGTLLLDSADVEGLTLDSGYLDFIQRPTEAYDGAKFSICSNLDYIPLNRDLFFFASSMPVIQKKIPELKSKANRDIEIIKVAEYNNPLFKLKFIEK